MKILLDVVGVALLARDPQNYIVADSVVTDEKGVEHFKHARFFPTVASALEEMREVYQTKKLMNKATAKSMAEFISRIEKISKDWYAFIKMVEISGLKGVKKVVG